MIGVFCACAQKEQRVVAPPSEGKKQMIKTLNSLKKKNVIKRAENVAISKFFD